jgi:signal transduction protein with GAF and PtsI domain
MERLQLAARQEIAQALGALCHDAGAAESSVLLPRDEDSLAFFASSNAALMQPGIPTVPIAASFSGLAFRSGQTLAYADASQQTPHFKAVDEAVGQATHEFAAIPIIGRTTLGVLTLVNRPQTSAAGSAPFTLDELRRAEAAAQALAAPLAWLGGLDGGKDTADGVSADLLADLMLLTEPERRVVHSLANALLQNRAE